MIEDFKKKNNIIISTTIISIIIVLISISVLIFSISPASHYELSIYKGISIFFWIVFIMGILLVSWTLFLYASNSLSIRIKNTIMLYIISGVILEGMFILLPYIKGYPLYSYGTWDVLTHIGRIKSILLTSHIDQENFYPIFHVLGTIIILIVKIKINTLQYLFGLCFGVVLFIISVIFWGITVSKMFGLEQKRMLSSIISLIVVPIFYHYTLTFQPSILSIYLLPLSYSVTARSTSDKRYVYITLILLIWFIFAHPSTAFYVLIGITLYLYGMKQTRSLKYLSLIFITIYLTWILKFYILHKTLKSIINSLILGKESLYITEIQRLRVQSSEIKLRLFDMVKVFYFKYGYPLMAVFIIILIMTSFVLIKNNRKKNPKTKNAVSLMLLQVLYSGILAVLGTYGYLHEASIIRIARYFMITSILFISIGIIASESNIPLSKKKIIIIILISLMIISSTLGTYLSPTFTLSPNPQFTKVHNQEVKWFFLNRDYTIKTSAFGYSWQILNYIYGVTSAKNIPFWWRFPEYDLPPRFCGTMGLCKCINSKSQIYVILSDFHKNLYKVYPKYLWDKAHVYLPKDVYQLRSSNKANIIYSSTDSEIYIWRCPS